MRTKPSHIVLLTATAAILLLTGCSSVDEMLPDQTLAYKRQKEASENLEVPPDLTGGSFDDRMDIPPLDGGAATYSEYSSGRSERRTAAASGAVLPSVESVDLRRSGDERWLEVQATPQVVWPQVVSFWRSQGILLLEQDPAVGVMKTDWLENRAEVRKDFVTRMMRSVADGLYATSTRDQFSVRIEPGPTSGSTDVRLTHRGMEEKLVTGALGDNERTVWEPSASDKGKESEMLRRLMLYLGASKQRADTAVASAAPAAPQARLASEGGAQVLLVPDEFRRAWRSTGSALDRAGFAVEDRDVGRGIYYVRYEDVDSSGRQKKGFMSRMAFWRKDDIDRVQQYQIRVQGDDTQSRVSVLDKNGNPDGSPAASRILALLSENMR